MAIKIDFEALIKVMLNELESKHPNEIMNALQISKELLGGSIKNNPKFWFSALGISIIGVDGRDY